jgi:hypothetical protein
MIRQCFRAKTGIQFHREAFKDVGLDPATLYPFVIDRPAALEPSASNLKIAEVGASGHSVEATDATLADDDSPTSASNFKSEEEEELTDALSLMYDQLKLSKFWWLLEIIPLRHHVQNQTDLRWKPYWKYVFFFKSTLFVTHAGVIVLFRVNLGRPRQIPGHVRERKEKIFVHRSVKTRMDAEGLKGGKYEPKAKFDHLNHEWVE